MGDVLDETDLPAALTERDSGVFVVERQSRGLVLRPLVYLHEVIERMAVGCGA